MNDLIPSVESIFVAFACLTSCVWQFIRPSIGTLLLPILFGVLTWFGLIVWHDYTYVYQGGGADFYGFVVFGITFLAVCASAVGLLIGLGIHYLFMDEYCRRSVKK